MSFSDALHVESLTLKPLVQLKASGELRRTELGRSAKRVLEQTGER